MTPSSHLKLLERLNQAYAKPSHRVKENTKSKKLSHTKKRF
jgi:hypothetical protein